MYDVHTSNSFQDITHNHWTMKHRSQWPSFIFRSTVWSYWLINPNNDVHTSNSLQDTRQNHWTMKYGVTMTYFIFRSNVGPYWLIISKNDVHTPNSLQDTRQNHWTMKYRSCWPSPYDPQVHVTGFSHVLPTICKSCFHNRESRKTLIKVSYILTSSPTPGNGPWGQESWHESRPSRLPMVQIGMLSDEWLVRYTPPEKL